MGGLIQMVRPKKQNAVELKRIQFDLTPERLDQLSLLQKHTRSISYRETFETLMKLSLHIYDAIENGDAQLDLEVIKKLCFR